MSFDPNVPDLPGMIVAERMHGRFPSRPDWIEPTVEYLRQRALLCGACDEARAGKIMIGLHEAISNAIVHGNLEISSELKEQGDSAFAQELASRCADERYASRMVTVEVDYDGSECRWAITDQGNGFDVAKMIERDPTTGEEILLSSGRGMLLMRAFFDFVRYESGGRRVVLVLQKKTNVQLRRSLRLSKAQRVKIIPLLDDGTVDWEAASEGLSHNLSTDGIAVLHAQLANAQRVLIGLEAGNEPLYVPAVVRRCRQVSPDFVELGCQFERPAPDSQAADSVQAAAALRAIADLVERLKGPRSHDDERRAHPRMAFTCPVQIIGGKEGEPTVGYGRDLSKGGIAFVTTGAISLRSCHLTLPSMSGPPVRVAVRISRCSRIMDGFFDVCAHFEHLGEY
jgi:anti-sigma regulatory factor (Ser/Thr protein kinase)